MFGHVNPRMTILQKLWKNRSGGFFIFGGSGNLNRRKNPADCIFLCWSEIRRLAGFWNNWKTSRESSFGKERFFTTTGWPATYGSDKSIVILYNPTDTFTILELQNLSYDAPDLHKTRWSPDLDALKLCNCSSGTSPFTNLELYYPSYARQIVSQH